MTFVILLYCHQTEKGKEWENNFNPLVELKS